MTLTNPETNSYQSAQKRNKIKSNRADFTIDQNWQSYTQEEHDRWDRLYDRQVKLLPGRACTAYLEALEKLELGGSGIPDLNVLSRSLGDLTGWQVVAVGELVPSEIFYEHLANKRFPAGAFIRSEAEFDYIEEPDIFHDVFGHVPLLGDKQFSEFMQAFGRAGQRAAARGKVHYLAHLYWYTVEFGLIREDDDLRIFGAGILSSPAETKFALESSSPNRIVFNLERMMRTNYIKENFQQTYFVIDSFDQLLKDCEDDFDLIYDRISEQRAIEPDDLIEGDGIVTRGDGLYFTEQGH